MAGPVGVVINNNEIGQESVPRVVSNYILAPLSAKPSMHGNTRRIGTNRAASNVMVSQRQERGSAVRI